MAVETKVDPSLHLKSFEGPQKVNMDDLEHIPVKLPQLATFCDDYDVSLPRLLQLIWGAVLRTYTGSNDISFRCIFPPPGGSERDLEERVCHFEMVQDISAIDLLRDDTQNWNREVRSHDIDGCDTLLFWKQNCAGIPCLSQEYHTLNVGAMAPLVADSGHDLTIV